MITFRPLTRRATTRYTPIPDPLTPELGAWGRALTTVFAIAGPFFAFQVIATLPVLISVPVLGLTFGAFLLAPATVVKRLPIPLVWLALIIWILASLTWTRSLLTADFMLKRDLAFWIGFPVLGGLVPWQRILSSLVWFVRLMLIVTTFLIITRPDARTHLDPTGLAVATPGWHGLFDHKNTMAPVLVFGFVTLWYADHTRILRWLGFIGTAILIVGSQSITGLSAGIAALSMLVWFEVLERVEGRDNAPFMITSAAAVAAIGIGAFASLRAIVQVAGKDLTFSGRTSIWTATWHAIQDQPLTGYGIGGLFSNPPTSTTQRVNAEIGFNVPHAHNGLLDLVAQYGIIGGTLFLACLGIWLYTSIRVYRIEPTLGSWGLTLLVTLFIVGLSEAVFGGPWLSLMGLVLAMNYRVLNEQRRLEHATDPAERAAPEPSQPESRLARAKVGR